MNRFFVVVGLLLASPFNAHGYDGTWAHPELAEASLEQSALVSDRVTSLWRLGYAPDSLGLPLEVLGLANDVDLTTRRFPNGDGEHQTILQLIRYGSEAEDFLTRPRHHFYDPRNDIPLTVVTELGEKSPSWALEDEESFLFQWYSLSDGLDHLYQGLIATEKERRREHAGQFFRILGHTLHHIQDMAQPEHTRNDQHLVGKSLYEVTTEDWVRVDPGRVDQLVMYPASKFDAARGYWDGSRVIDGRTRFRAGITEFSHYNFVSADTNFKINDSNVVSFSYPEPVPLNADDPEFVTFEQLYGFDEGRARCEAIKQTVNSGVSDALQCGMGFVWVRVYDDYTGEDYIDKRAASLSVFDAAFRELDEDVLLVEWPEQDVEVDRVFSVNEFTFTSARESLLPRAIGYGAGMIDHVLRGRLEVSPPGDGVFAMVDHSENIGFSKLKMRVKEDMEGDVNFSDGVLVAVAEFHRNPCYEPDLSGEFDLNFEIEGCVDPRTEETERVRSTELDVAEIGEEYVEVTFDFPESAIPINATDLRLQVVYRGSIGEEAGQVAVERVDISEPTYISFINSTDQMALDGEFHSAEEIRSDPALLELVDSDGDGEADVNIDPFPLDIDMALRDGEFSTVMEKKGLEPGRVARVAVLRAGGDEPIPVGDTVTFEPPVAYADQATSPIYLWAASEHELGPGVHQYYVHTDGSRSPYATRYPRLRGVAETAGVIYYVNLDGSEITESDLDALPELVERLPQPVTLLWE